MRRNIRFSLCLVLSILNLVFVGSVFSGEQGHYAPAPMAVRDYVMPSKGFYVIGYDTYYHADKMKDSSGNTFDSVSVSGSWRGTVKSYLLQSPVLSTRTWILVYIARCKPLRLPGLPIKRFWGLIMD